MYAMCLVRTKEVGKIGIFSHFRASLVSMHDPCLFFAVVQNEEEWMIRVLSVAFSMCSVPVYEPGRTLCYIQGEHQGTVPG